MYGLITETVKNNKVFNYEALANAVNQTKIVNDIKARHLASTHKRLDVCAAEIASVLHLVPELKVQDKVCLEIGCGWVLSYAVIYHLLGAKRIIATDINPMANPARIFDALHHSTTYVIRDVLAAFGEHEAIRDRLDHLLSIKNFDEKTLEDLGIIYQAPMDFALGKFSEPVDFIYSRSTMNHLPRHLVEPILQNLYDSLKPGGLMTHDIHLEDVKNFERAPFAFYEIPMQEYLPEYDGLRGNRIRASQWEELFSQVSGGNARAYYHWKRKASELPLIVDGAIKNNGKDDLRTSHVGIVTKRN